MHTKPNVKKGMLSQLFAKPERAMALGFFTVIVLGAILLLLPISSTDNQSIGIRKALFTSTSAVCVTGLSIIDVVAVLSGFGQGVLLGLIQIGGLGFMVFTTFIMITLGKRISLRNRLLIRESMNQSNLSGMVRLTLAYFILALAIEITGALILMTKLIPKYGLEQGIWFSVFHSVSAFCNAGFDLFGNYESLYTFSQDPVVLLTIITLIVLGGLGFAVLIECVHHKFRFKPLSVHAKLVLISTAILIILGTALIFLFEYDNTKTLGHGEFSKFDMLLNSLFQSVTFRTAGFSTLDQAALTDSSKLLGIVFMFIGASPASTGGGVKTVTFALLVLMVVSVIRGRANVQIFKKKINTETTRRSVAITFIALSLVIFSTVVISVILHDSNYLAIDILFETTSAFSTTGLSSIFTPRLSPIVHWLLMPLMYFGRVGPLTLALAFASKLENRAANRINYPEEKIMIG